MKNYILLAMGSALGLLWVHANCPTGTLWAEPHEERTVPQETLGDIEAETDRLIQSLEPQQSPLAMNENRVRVYHQIFSELSRLENSPNNCPYTTNSPCVDMNLMRFQLTLSEVTNTGRNQQLPEEEREQITKIKDSAWAFPCQATPSGSNLAGNLGSGVVNSFSKILPGAIIGSLIVNIYRSFRSASYSYSYDETCIQDYTRKTLELMPEDAVSLYHSQYRNNPGITP